MFWLSSWDDLHSYSVNLNEDVFLRSFFYYMVNDKYSSNFFLSNYKIIKYSDKFNFNTNKTISSANFSDFLFRQNKLPYYISKVRILKFQKWLIIYFYLYNYDRKILSNKIHFNNLIKFQKKNNLFFFKKKINFSYNF
jgi:hypothetical protein